MREKISTTGPTQDTAAATDTTNLQSAWSAAMPDYYAGVMEPAFTSALFGFKVANSTVGWAPAVSYTHLTLPTNREV